MSANPFDHAFLSGLLGDEELGAFFTVESDLSAMLKFELALAHCCAGLGIIPNAASAEIHAGLANFKADHGMLNAAVVSDGVVIPNLIAQMREQLPADVRKHLHFGATSQDVIDSSLMMRMTNVLGVVDRRLGDIIDVLLGLEAAFGANDLMGHTRMQAALPITVKDRLISWRRPLAGQRQELQALLKQGLPLQLGGAVGILEKYGDQGDALRAAMAQSLGLSDQAQWHSQRSVIVDLAHIFAKISGSLGKIGQDVALMAQAGREISLSGGGASSAMPHKQNPVAAEVLVAQARFTATLVAGTYQSLVHEQERSGAAWTLEWMILPQVTISLGASTATAGRLLSSIERIG